MRKSLLPGIFAGVVSLIIIISLLLVCIPLYRTLTERLEEAKQRIIAQLETQLGYTISYDSVSPSIFSYIEIRNLRLRDEDDTSILNLSRVRLFYRLTDLLKQDFLSAPTGLQIRGGTISIPDSVVLQNESRENDDIWENLQGVLLPIVSEFPANLPISADGILVSYTTEGSELSVFLQSGEISVERDFIQLELDLAGRWLADQWVSSLEHTQSLQIDARTSVLGTISRRTLNSNFLLSLSHLSGSFFDAEPMQFQIDLSSQGINIAKVLDAQPFTAEVQIPTDLSQAKISFVADAWQPVESSSSSIQYLDPIMRELFRGLTLSGTVETLLRFDGPQSEPISIDSFAGDLSLEADLPSLSGRLQSDIKLQGSNTIISIDNLALSTQHWGRIRYRGSIDPRSMMPQGQISYQGFNIDTDITLRSKDNELQLSTTKLSIGSISIPELSVIGSVGQEELTLDMVARLSPWPGQSLYENSVKIGLIAPRPSFSDSDSPSDLLNDLGISLFINKLHGGVVHQLLRVYISEADTISPEILSFLRTVTLSLNAHILFRDGTPLITADDVILTNSQDEHFLISGGAQLRERNLRITTTQIITRDFQGTFDGLASISETGTVRFGLRTNLLEQEILLNGIVNDGRAAVDSNLGFNAVLDFSTENIFLTAKGEGIPITLLSQDGRLDFSLQGDFSDLTSWNISGLNISLSSILPPGLGSQDSNLRLSITGSYPDLQIDQFAYSDNESEITGSGEVSLDIGAQMKIGASLQLQNQKNPREQISLVGDYEESAMNARINIDNLNLLRMKVDGLRGFLDASITVEGTTLDPSVEIEGTVQEAFFNADPLSGQFSATYESSGIRLNQLELGLVAIGIRVNDGFIDLENSTGTIDAAVIVPDIIDTEEGLTMSARFRLRPGTTENPSLFNTLVADMDLQNVPEFLSDVSAWKVRVAPDDLQPDTLVISGGPSESLFAQVHSDGSFDVLLKQPLFLTLSGSGRIQGGEIDIDIPHAIWNSPDLSSLLFFDIFSINKGRAEGNARIVGDINDPSFYGVFKVTDLEAWLEYSPQTIGPADAFIIFEDKTMIIPEFTVTAGNAVARVVGELGFSRWIPETYDFSFTVDDQNSGLEIEYDFDTVVVQGYGYGTVDVVGDLNLVEVTGNITAAQTAITLSPALTSGNDQQTSEPIETDTYVNFQFKSDRGVEFFWPTTDVPLFRGLVEPDADLSLEFDTRGNRLLLRGDVPLRGGEIFYFDRNFYVRSGVMLFNETEESFNPRLSLSAENRTSWNGERVIIKLAADENYLTDIQPRFTSDPILSIEELNAMLGGGLLPTNTQDPYNIVSQAFITSADIFSQFQIMRNIENTIRSTLALDLFSIRTGLFQNIVRDVIDTEDSFSFGRYFENTTVLVGKFIGDDVFLETMFQISEENPLSRSLNDPIGVELSWEFNIEWQTPLFLLQWNFNPQFTPENVKNLFVTDHLLTFSWDFN